MLVTTYMAEKVEWGRVVNLLLADRVSLEAVHAEAEESVELPRTCLTVVMVDLGSSTVLPFSMSSSSEWLAAGQFVNNDRAEKVEWGGVVTYLEQTQTESRLEQWMGRRRSRKNCR